MPYIGNTIRAADDYRLIDDISSSFNGSATSFALQVAGSAPVPFPKSPQQVLISVNGVIQEPDPSGSSGFNLVGTNIVFSSAPTGGHAFFGIIYATADYLNAGGNFPAGSLGAPSITFIGDENTGLYRKGGGSIGFVADATEIANTDSNGLTISSGNLILPADIIHSGDTDTKIRFPAADTFSVETGGAERLSLGATTVFNETGADVDFRIEGDTQANLFYVDAGNNRIGVGTSSPSAQLSCVLGATGTIAQFRGADTDILNIDGDSNQITLDARNIAALAFEIQGTEAMRINSSGNVGIGTASPGHRLHLKGTDTAYGGSVAVGSILELEDAAGRKSQFIAPGAVGEAGAGTPTSHDFTLFTNNTERIRIKNTGNVGIGTSSPETLLHAKVNTFSDDINKVALTLSNNQSSGVHQYFQNASTGTGVSNGARIGLGNTDHFLIQQFEAKDIQISTSGINRLTIDSDGHVTAAKSIVSENLPGRNILINGDMRVAQRATSASMSAAGNTYDVCDRWSYNRNGVTSTLAQVDEVPDGSGFQNSLKITTTSAVGSISAGNMLSFAYRIEGQDIRRLGYGSSDAKTATISFWVRGSLSGKIGVNCARDSRTFSANEDIVANTWKFVEIVIPADTSTGLSAADTDAGFDLSIRFAAGSNFTSGTTGGNWIGFHTAYAAGFTAGQQGAYLTTNGSTIQVTGVQLEIGSKATPFDHKCFTEQLQKCKRYYYKSMQYATPTTQPIALSTNNTTVDLDGFNGWVLHSTSGCRSPIFDHPVEMRGLPTVQIYSSGRVTSPANNELALFNGSSWINVSSTSPRQNTRKIAFVGSLSSGLTQFSAYLFGGGYDCDAEL